MASIIIDEIVPTTWRLRLRGADGQTREVDYKAGTPLRLDAAASPTEARPRDGAPPKDRREKPPAGAEKSRTDTKRADERATPTKPASDTTAANAEKPEPQKPQQARRRKHEAGPGPGDLVWEETEDDGVTGVRASFARGSFKILHACGESYGIVEAQAPDELGQHRLGDGRLERQGDGGGVEKVTKAHGDGS